ncbi:VirK family protein [Luteibacter sp. ME-Dv--P-043b]|uniref:VirK family protein n=1 Tax=unclassified Luteibacter TaxID=2620188 RepID=UPI00255566CB|nr:VirK family protein [Luteibacter sp. ME-Dv--P-043b]
MMNMRLSLLAALAAVVPISASMAQSPSSIYSLEELKTAADNGANIAVTVDLTKCKPTGTTTAPGTTKGGLKIGAYRVTPDGVFSFSDAHETVGQDGKPLWQFLRYQVKPDQTVAFTAFMYSLPTYTPLGPEITYECGINRGVTFIPEHH